jgi:DHA3 family tetracycline resistance protein-like MFS transporter
MHDFARHRPEVPKPARRRYFEQFDASVTIYPVLMPGSRVKIMFLSDLGRGALVIGVAFLASSDLLRLWHLYVASLLFGFVDAFFQPAYTAAVPAMTPPEALPSANSLTSLSQQLGRIVGPPLGAVMMGLVGIPAAFALNGISFLIAAGCLVPLLRSSAPTASSTEPQRSGVWRDLREGFDTVRASPWLWITIGILAISNVTLSGPYSVALPVLVKQDLHTGVGTLGFLYAMFPIGYAVAAVWLGSAAKLRRRGLTIYWGLIVAGLMLLVFGLPVSVYGLAIAAILNGLALELAGLSWTNLLQEQIPGEKLGRVSSIDSLGSFALLPVGYGITGCAVDWLGAPLAFLIGGGLTAALAALALMHPAIRRLD